MPSGAKKRKAAKKKLQKQSNNIGSHSNSNKGSDDEKFRDERDGDGGDVEREGNVESGVNNCDDEGAKEVSSGEGNVTEEVKQQEESLEDVIVHTDDVAGEFQSVASKSTSSSGSGSGSGSGSNSSSSSDDDEVVVEKEQSVETESETLEPQNGALSEELVAPPEYVEASLDNMVEEFVESIPTEELVKLVVSMPEESSVVSESVPVDDISTFDVIASGLKQNVDEVIQSFEKSEVASGIIDLVESKIEEKVMPFVDVGSQNTSDPIIVTPQNDEEVLSQPSGVKAVEVEDNGKPSESHKHTEEEPLLSSAPVAVRRTSWTNCCGLLEVFSGGAR